MKRNEGITLVALVVTIVVLLILAGISLSLILGQNGIIKKATDGKTNYSVAQGEEENTLNNASDWIDQNTGKPKANPLPHDDTTTPYLPSGCTQVADTDLDNGLTIKDSKGNEYVWVVVPRNEEAYQTAGLSVTDFNDDAFTKIEHDLRNYSCGFKSRFNNSSDAWSSKDVNGLEETEYYTLKKQMLKSIYKNGGFWIGKYETATDDVRFFGDSNYNNITPQEIDNTPVIKQNKYPYNYVTCSQAETLSKSLNPDSSKYNCDLLFGVQWDLTLRFLYNHGTASYDLNEDGKDIGNVHTSEFSITNPLAKYSLDYAKTWTSAPYTKIDGNYIELTTGAVDKFQQMNIYDMGGNFLEFTLENSGNDSNPTYARGGQSDYNGDMSYSSHGDYETTNRASYFISFRTTLYEK